MLIFSFRARAGRLLLLDVFLPNIVLARHVLGMSVMRIKKKPLPREDPLQCWLPESLRDVFFESWAAMEVPSLY
jgi:hypothetical protein